jgi:regulator of protease activity HflC (stomatin/prohibitin superfamily)
MTPVTILVILGVVIVITLLRTARVVPHQTVFIVERLGKYSRTLLSGFHILIPFVDRVAYKHTLKEQAIDVPPQMCITCDNIAVEVDGVLYLQVTDPARASYGIMDYRFATIQLAQTTMRSLIGKLTLDRTFEERETTNSAIVLVLDEASDPWGVKVTRYEVKNIEPPQSIRDAMEKQMRAEREKRALIAESEGDREAKINRAEGEKQQNIRISEGEKLRQINVAEGRAQEIELVAAATAKGIRAVAEAIGQSHGSDAVSLRVAEQYVNAFANLAQAGNTLIIPQNLTDVGGTVAALTRILKSQGGASTIE